MRKTDSDFFFDLSSRLDAIARSLESALEFGSEPTSKHTLEEIYRLAREALEVYRDKLIAEAKVLAEDDVQTEEARST